MSSTSTNGQRRVIQSTVSSFSININSDLSIANNNTLVETMMMFNLVNIISKTTRITNQSNTLLNPIIISDTINYIYSDILMEPSEISNQCIIISY
jgi:hypothetical protein